MEEKCILLVEDNPDDVLLTRRALIQSRIVNKLVVAQDGSEALDYLFCQGNHVDRNPKLMPEVVLLDLKLPRIDGLEVLRRIRDDQRTHLLPVVVLTSSLEEKDVVQSYKLSCNSYIRKPVDFSQFAEAVRQLGLYWLVLNQAPTKLVDNL
jgi:two-component system, response regulator